MKRRFMFPLILELVGIATVGGGIGIEIAMKADIGYVIISVGSVLVAGGGIVWGKFIKSR